MVGQIRYGWSEQRGEQLSAFVRTCFAAPLGLLREVEERGDLLSLEWELDRKVDEPFDVERRSGEVNHSVFPGPDVQVLSAAVIREDDPLVLALPQVVLDELVNQLVGEMLQDVLGMSRSAAGRSSVMSPTSNLILSFSCFLRTASMTSAAMSTPR